MRFCFEHTLPVPRERVFAFFENPQRLEVLHAGWSQVRVLQAEHQVRVGAELWVEVTLGAVLPVVLGFRHARFEPPRRFAEEAIHGPFSRFTHVHEFEARNGTTLVRDLLELCLPWHYGGERAMEHGVGPGIRRMFQHRAAALTRLAADGVMAGAVPFRPSASER